MKGAAMSLVRNIVEKTCGCCGARFQTVPSRADRAKFCSRRCADKAKRALVVRTCEVCGKTFDHHLSQLKFFPKGGRYCSIACASSVRGQCVVCGEAFQGRNTQKYCEQHRGRFYMALGEIERRAYTLASTLSLPNKRPLVAEMLTAAIGQPCVYCATTITVKNASLDHKEPIGKELRNGPAALRREADRLNNLQIICKPCNSAKGDFNDAEMRSLLLLPLWPKLRRRLSASQSFWTLQSRLGTLHR